jgi:hypothetical protein
VGKERREGKVARESYKKEDRNGRWEKNIKRAVVTGRRGEKIGREGIKVRSKGRPGRERAKGMLEGKVDSEGGKKKDGKRMWQGKVGKEKTGREDEN